jgi:hypothetical protein
MQGTLGFYFGDKTIYTQSPPVTFCSRTMRVMTNTGIKVRLNYFFLSFPIDRDSDYTYIGGPRKEVVVMGPPASDDYVASIQAKIGTFNDTVTYLETRAAAERRRIERAEAGSAQAEQFAKDLEAT